jgi:prolyl-tRNA synthetase
LINTNSGRDYTAEIVEDLTMVTAGNSCFDCGAELSQQRAEILASREKFNFDRILLTLAEIHHDEKGLALPKSAAPFDVHLMHVPGKMINTLEKAEGIYKSLQAEGISVLFDDREERAGVKFNDADLIGCPIRVTVGERGLQSNAVEVKQRKDSDAKIIPIPELINHIKWGSS